MNNVIQCRFSEFLIQLCIKSRFFGESVQKYYCYVQKNRLFWASCRNITGQEPGAPGFSCRAIFGVREEILIFWRNIHLCGETFTCSSTNYKTYRHTITSAEEGRWVYRVVANEVLVSISVKVESKSREPSTDPVMSRCWISSDGQELDTTTAESRQLPLATFWRKRSSGRNKNMCFRH